MSGLKAPRPCYTFLKGLENGFLKSIVNRKLVVSLMNWIGNTCILSFSSLKISNSSNPSALRISQLKTTTGLISRKDDPNCLSLEASVWPSYLLINKYIKLARKRHLCKPFMWYKTKFLRSKKVWRWFQFWVERVLHWHLWWKTVKNCALVINFNLYLNYAPTLIFVEL